MLFVGDYIYEIVVGPQPGAPSRHRPADDARSNIASATRSTSPTADLQAAHAAHPWIVTWDDHEVTDDYTGDIGPADPDPARFLAQRAAAYQAFWEHMPLPNAMRPDGPSLRLYDRYRFGDLAELHVLDDRQYRSHHACRATLDARQAAGELRRAARSRAHHAGRRAGGVVRRRHAARLGALEPGRAADADGRGRPRAGRAPRLLGRRLGRLSGSAPAAARRRGGVAGARTRWCWAATSIPSGPPTSSATSRSRAGVATEFVGGSITSQGRGRARVKAVLAQESAPALRPGPASTATASSRSSEEGTGRRSARWPMCAIRTRRSRPRSASSSRPAVPVRCRTSPGSSGRRASRRRR